MNEYFVFEWGTPRRKSVFPVHFFSCFLNFIFTDFFHIEIDFRSSVVEFMDQKSTQYAFNCSQNIPIGQEFYLGSRSYDSFQNQTSTKATFCMRRKKNLFNQKRFFGMTGQGNIRIDTGKFFRACHTLRRNNN